MPTSIRRENASSTAGAGARENAKGVVHQLRAQLERAGLAEVVNDSLLGGTSLMLVRLLNTWGLKRLKKIPLRVALTVPFIGLIFAVVGLTGYLSFRNGQAAVNKVTTQLRSEIAARVEQYLDTYLALPHSINQTNSNTVQLEQLDLYDFPAIEQHLFSQLVQFDSVTAILLGNEQGYFNAVTSFGEPRALESDGPDSTTVYNYAIDSHGNRTKQLETLHLPDVRDRPWYRAAAQAGKPVWSNIFQPPAPYEDLALNASWPIYDRTADELLGVFSVNIMLSKINDFLKSLQVGRSGEVFIIDRSGLLIASSVEETPFTTSSGTEQVERLEAIDSSNALVNATAQHLTEQFGDLNAIEQGQQFDFNKDGERQLAQVLPFEDEFGLDWLIVLVMPESDFMEQINAGTRNTILLCLIALMATTVIGILTTWWVARPISSLRDHVQALARGEWEQKIIIDRADEVGELARSFNDMARQLQTSFASLESNNEQLQQEIAERVRAEEQLKQSLAEKTTLLQELYHRTKNNMQVIHSMLELRSLYVQDKQLLIIIKDVQDRIHAMALVHQKLYESRDLSRIDLKEYIDDLTAYLMQNYQVQSNKISLDLDTESVFVVIDTAIPCGLILSELISNALKHAFPGDSAGRISIRLHQTKGETVTLEVSDNGIGVPGDLDFKKSNSLGLQTVLGIVEHQLCGETSFATDDGVA